MNAILLISLFVFIVLPMICSALFLIARVSAVHSKEGAQQTTVHTEEKNKPTTKVVAC